MKNKLLIMATAVMLLVVPIVLNFSSILDYIAFSAGIVVLGILILDLLYLYREKRRKRKC